MKWTYYHENFDYEGLLDDIGLPWSGHKYFAYDLVRNIKPKMIVELGTFKGTSFFSFCQGVKDEKTDCSLYAIDTWGGDEHSGFYSNQIFNDVVNIKEKFYSDIKATLLRKTFDEAVVYFEDETIDILHIDGLHTYEAVKNDFENWIPKVKNDGVIIFHDIVVTKDDFGVFHLWSELKRQYGFVEFFHSYGLGVISKSMNANKILLQSKDELERHYASLVKSKESAAIFSLQNALKSKQLLVQEQEVLIREKNKEINTIKSSKFWKSRQFYLKFKGKTYGKIISFKKKLFSKSWFKR